MTTTTSTTTTTTLLVVTPRCCEHPYSLSLALASYWPVLTHSAACSAAGCRPLQLEKQFNLQQYDIIMDLLFDYAQMAIQFGQYLASTHDQLSLSLPFFLTSSGAATPNYCSPCLSMLSVCLPVPCRLCGAVRHLQPHCAPPSPHQLVHRDPWRRLQTAQDPPPC